MPICGWNNGSRWWRIAENVANKCQISHCTIFKEKNESPTTRLLGMINSSFQITCNKNTPKRKWSLTVPIVPANNTSQFVSSHRKPKCCSLNTSAHASNHRAKIIQSFYLKILNKTRPSYYTKWKELTPMTISEEASEEKVTNIIMVISTICRHLHVLLTTNLARRDSHHGKILSSSRMGCHPARRQNKAGQGRQIK